MLDLDSHARKSAEVRNAARCATELGQNLLKLNSGPVFEHEQEKLIGDAKQKFEVLAKFMGEHKTYNIGEKTMAKVFTPNELTNVSDLQAVFDAIESAFLMMDTAILLARRD